jgi:flagellin
MGFRINTNIGAMNAHRLGVQNNTKIDSSLEKLSSGLRINKAADDSSGLAIADSLRSQSSSLGQAISNANDAMGIIQTADKAMDEQIKILDTIKMKSIQAASDNQSNDSRNAIQKDVNRLLEQLDNIAHTTSFNGRNLLDGKFSNKEFQVGAYSNQTIAASIGNTSTTATGNITTKSVIAQLGNIGSLDQPAVKGVDNFTTSGMEGVAVGDTIRIDGVGDYTVKEINGTEGGDTTFTLDRGLEKDLAVGTDVAIVQTAQEQIDFTEFNNGILTDATGFAVGDKISVTRGDGSVQTVAITGLDSTSNPGQTAISFDQAIDGTATNIQMLDRKTLGTDHSGSDFVQFTVEGVKLPGVQLTDTMGNGTVGTGLGAAAEQINLGTAEHGIKAFARVESNSVTKVTGGDIAEDIVINGQTILGAGDTLRESDVDNKLVNAINAKTAETGVTANLKADGTLTLVSDGRAMNLQGLTNTAGLNDGVVAGEIEFTRNELGVMNVSSEHFKDEGLIQANGAAASLDEIVDAHQLFEIGSGAIRDEDPVGLLRTREGAMRAMDLSEAATKELDSIRADLGSVQNQLTVTVNNISVTQVNVKAAESQIRDVDFAKESATFNKHNILAQSGSYAMSQANSVQQNVMRLLQ